jgi:nickel superoxide dismutase
MRSLRTLFRPSRVVDAHCDIPCGVYDPEQARIEAESCLRIIEKYPNLHETFWKATKQASKVKQSLDAGAAKELLGMIDTIDEMWKSTGGLEKTRVNGRPS